MEFGKGETLSKIESWKTDFIVSIKECLFNK